MKWFKENYKLVGFILGIFAVIFSMGSFTQQVKTNKETIDRILINLEKLPTPEELEALDVKLEFIIEMMKEQHKIIIAQFDQIEKRMGRIEQRIEQLENISDKQ